MNKYSKEYRGLSPVDRFEASYCKQETGCWEWVGTIRENNKGMKYGRFFFQGKTHSAHRWIWEHLKGKIPEGSFACHKCDNSLCVNPDHLFIGTAKENNRDMGAKGRHWAQQNPAGARANLKKARRSIPKGKAHWNYRHGRYSQA